MNKEIVYSVFVKHEGKCEMLAISNHFILIPAFNDDYTITCRLIKGSKTETSITNSSRVHNLKQSASIIIHEIIVLQDSLLQLSDEINSLTNNDYWFRQRELELYGVQTYTIHDTTELYKDHDFKSKIMASIPPKSKVRVLEKYGYYLKIDFNGKRGWIKSGWIVLHEDIVRLDDKRLELKR